MADHFVDSVNGSNANSGHTMDLSWLTVEYAMESGGLAAGDVVWIRRGHSEVPSSNIVVSYDGTINNFIKVIGWPRTTLSITSASWTQGSTTVDLILPATMSWSKNCGRYITGLDGSQYLITKITDTNTIIIDREYAGSTVTLLNGAATISADEDYSTAQAIDDTGWTINKAAWNADADTLALIDFNSTLYYVNFSSDDYWYLANMEFKNPGNYLGGIYHDRSKGLFLYGCLFSTTVAARPVIQIDEGHLYIKRTILDGTGVSSSLIEITQGYYGPLVRIEDAAIYNANAIGITYPEHMSLKNVNIGVEVANTNYDISIVNHSNIDAVDLKLGGTNGSVLQASTYTQQGNFYCENYGKILGAHKTFCNWGSWVNMAVVAGSGDPQKRTSGADEVMEVVPDVNEFYDGDMADTLFVHEFEATTATKAYRYYVQCLTLSLTATELWLKCEYVDSHNNITEYTKTKVVSGEACATRGSSSDWTQYIEVTGVTPAVASKVRITCKIAKYHATGKIYIDPLVVIS